MKRVKPFFKSVWLKSLDEYMKEYDFWEVGITEKLEREILLNTPRKHALAVDSTSNAIFMSLYIWHKIHPYKDEVIFPNWGYPATFKACRFLGLTPIPVDMNIHTLGMDEDEVRGVLNNNTLAVVHIENNGIVGDPQSIKDLLDDDILFIEDSAPSMLQDGAGMYGDVSMFSFSPTKPFCVGGGSIILTDNSRLYSELKLLRHTPDYENKDATLNFMMSPYLIALLLPQFEYYDALCYLRSNIHMQYKDRLKIFEEPYIKTNRHGSIMYLSERAAKISKALYDNDIQHRYKGYPCFVDDYINFPISCQIRNQLLDLPIHHRLGANDIEKICSIINEVENA